jgi:hypothetical protein
MKNQILPFLLGVFVMISIAAGSIATNLVTIKPATPKLFYVCVLRGEETIAQRIRAKMKEGYVVDKMMYSHYEAQTILVMVKY